MDTTKITLPRLKTLWLQFLPELKSICSSSKVISCDSLEKILIRGCPKLKRLPLSLPLLNGQLSLPLLLNKLKQRKNGGNRWSGTVKTLRMSFNPSFSEKRKHIFDLSFMDTSISLLLSLLIFSLNLIYFPVLVRYRINGQVEADIKCFRSACEQGELYSQTYFCLILFFFFIFC